VGDGEAVKVLRQQLIDGMAIFDISELAKTLGIGVPAALSRKLFAKLFPTAQDATRGQDYATRVEALMQGFRRAGRFSQRRAIVFEMEIGTRVKSYEAHDKVTEHKEMKPVKIDVYALLWPFPDHGDALTFYLKEEYEQFLLTLNNTRIIQPARKL